MNLSIDDPEAYRLAKAISHVTGQTMNRVVTDALRDRYQAIEGDRRKADASEILAIAHQVTNRLRSPAVDHGDFLYDENGLPK